MKHIAEFVREGLKEAYNLIDAYEGNLDRAWTGTDGALSVSFTIKVDEASEGRKKVDTAISFVESKISDKSTKFVSDEQEELPFDNKQKGMQF